MKRSRAMSTVKELRRTKTAGKKKLMVKKAGTTLALAQELQTLKRRMTLVAPPVKSVYSEFASTANESGWTTFFPSLPAKGGLPNQRLGGEIHIKSVNFRVHLEVSTADNYDSMRVTGVQLKEGNVNGAYPDGWEDDIWFSRVPNSYPWLCPFNTQKASSYRIFHDMVYQMNENGVVEHFINIVLLPSDLSVTKIIFNDDDGGAFPGTEGGLFGLLFTSNSDTAPHPSFKGTCKINFTDT